MTSRRAGRDRTPTREPVETPIERRGGRLDALRQALGSRAALRQAMLLHEVLGPPKTLRDKMEKIVPPFPPAAPSTNGHDRRRRDVDGLVGLDLRTLPSPTQTEAGGVHSTTTGRDESLESGEADAGIVREFAVRVSRAMRRAVRWLRRGASIP
jgi:hypothetical protein